MHVVAIAGQARAGKTTFAEMMAKHLFESGFTPRILSFAGPLREGLAAFGVTKTEHPDLYRKMAQVIGTDMLRSPSFLPGTTRSDWWVRLMHTRLAKVLSEEAEAFAEGDPRSETVVLVDDVRFFDELDLLQTRWQAVTAFVTRPNLPDADGVWRQHESEALARYFDLHPDEMQEQFDLIVGPDLDLEELEALVAGSAEAIATNSLTGFLGRMGEDLDD